jgi:RNA-directed DNA polymerase
VNSPAPLDVKSASERVLGWQTRLHRWAVGDEQARFGDLFNLICDPATLFVAWERVKRNRGSKTAGVDGETRKHIEALGVEEVLGELRQALRDRTYTPLPVREHEIPKRGSGKVRKLGIPALRDRIVQMATELVLEPIFEADFCPTSYGFRPGRRAQDAIEEVRFFINDPRTYEWVIEGDVENCFGSIHHGLLLAELRRRVTDKRVLALIRQFLRAGIMTHLGTLTDTPSGTPQGAILSPLLSNVALSVLDRRFEAAWVSRSPDQRKRDHAKGRPSYRMVRYADDFVVLVRGTEAQAHQIKEQTAEFMAEQMRLTLSPEKTHITHVDDGFDLLGFRIVRRSWRGTKRAAYTFPSKRAVRDVMHRIKTLTDRSTINLSLDELIHALNPILRGWANYHRHAASSRTFAYISYYLWWRVIGWLRKKHPRLTWKQIRRRCWGRKWTSREGTRLYWPAEVPIIRYRFRGHRIASPWATTTGTGRATTRPETAVA